MKDFKIICISIFLSLYLSLGLRAQLKITSTGDVSFSKSISVNSPYIESGSKIFSVYTGEDFHGRAVHGSCPPRANKFNIGVAGYSYIANSINSGRSYGVYGFAGGATSGYNYGVYGLLGRYHNGTGIFGSSNGDVNVKGRWAGYFYGDAKVTGDMYLGSVLLTSDIRSKKDIAKVESGQLAKLTHLNGIKYKLKTPTELGSKMRVAADTGTTAEIDPIMEAFYSQERIGLSAQEVQKNVSRVS